MEGTRGGGAPGPTGGRDTPVVTVAMQPVIPGDLGGMP